MRCKCLRWECPSSEPRAIVYRIEQAYSIAIEIGGQTFDARRASVEYERRGFFAVQYSENVAYSHPARDHAHLFVPAVAMGIRGRIRRDPAAGGCAASLDGRDSLRSDQASRRSVLLR